MAVARVENNLERTATLPAGYTSWEAYFVEFVALHESWREDHEARRGLKAMRLAPNLEVYRALLTGQDVPVSALDQRWARRYGLR